MKIGKANFDEIFGALNHQVRIHGGSYISLVVCGGTALAALGLITRTTKDADVLGLIKETISGLEIQRIKKFPDWLSNAAEKVARDFGLPDNWLNLGPASQVESGLPPGLADRLIRKKYGKSLSIYYISRTDQIYFKLYAAVDRNDYHTQDLFDLNPMEKELEDAAKWVLTQDVSEPFRIILKDFLERSGYGAIAERI
ncbi:hypothetical protein ES703_12618 [subsurface metagenome]